MGVKVRRKWEREEKSYKKAHNNQQHVYNREEAMQSQQLRVMRRWERNRGKSNRKSSDNIDAKTKQVIVGAARTSIARFNNK